MAWPGRPALRRVLGVSVAVGVFLSIVGAYGSHEIPFAPRTAFMIAISILATLMGVTAFALVSRAGRIARRWWLEALVAAALMTAPMAALVWLADQLMVRPRPPLRVLPQFLIISAASSLFFCLWAGYARKRALETRRAASAPSLSPPAPPRFLERLPPKLRGAEIWAVEAEDHYLRLHTSQGQDLILMRLSDAIAELDGLEGAQTHRSWWIARNGFVDVRRGDGRATLTLRNGVEAPVSRTFARELRARAWI